MRPSLIRREKPGEYSFQSSRGRVTAETYARNSGLKWLIYWGFGCYFDTVINICFLQYLFDTIPAPHTGEQPMKAAIYCRVSTDKQTTQNQNRELNRVAKKMGWKVSAVYSEVISGATDNRPELNDLMLSVTRNEVDVVMAWSVDRLGRSVQHLAGLLSDLHSKGVNLYLHQQGLDTTTPSGKAMFQMMGVFAEFEREMIRERINAGLSRAKEHGTKSGRPIGRPEIPPMKIRKVQELRGQGMTYKQVALATGVSERKCYEIMATM